MAPLHPQSPKTHLSMLTGTASPVWRPHTRERPGTVLAWSPAVPTPPLPMGSAARTELNGQHCEQPGRAGASPGCGQGVGAAAGVTGCLCGTGLTTWPRPESLDRRVGVGGNGERGGWRSFRVGQHHWTPADSGTLGRSIQQLKAKT